jgi:hypothetical protein
MKITELPVFGESKANLGYKILYPNPYSELIILRSEINYHPRTKAEALRNRELMKRIIELEALINNKPKGLYSSDI